MQCTTQILSSARGDLALATFGTGSPLRTMTMLLCCLCASSRQEAGGMQIQYLLRTSALLISMKRKELRHRALQRARGEAANGKKQM